MNDTSLNFFKHVNDLLENQIPFVTVTLVNEKGHVPQDIGAKIIVTESGLQFGTVGGGKVEAKAIQFAKELLSDKNPKEMTSNGLLLTWNLQTDVGMTCGGQVQLFFEKYFSNSWTIAVFGAGHVAQSVTRLLLGLNCQIHCVDPRKEWIDKLPDSPKLKKVCIPNPADYVKDLPPNTFIMSMTQGHAYDVPILKNVFSNHDFPYVGVIGSDVKAKIIKQELHKEGISQSQLEKLFCPMGLPLGNNAPNEIAISMVAQIIQIRDKLTASTTIPTI